jgi:dienelactone hydrolase
MWKGLKALFIYGVLAAGLAGEVAAAAAPQEVSYPSHDGTLIKAWVFLPDGPVPRGSVVALHGCGGLYASRGDRRGQLNARHQAMADMLVGQGYAAVFPDSLTPRGESELCTQKMGTRQINQTQRRADTLGTLAWIAAQPWATPGGIALLGWSHGGSAVLAATDLSRADVRAQLPQPALAVAFYPGCSAALKSGYRPSARLVLMLGEKDDWTPPGPCVELGKVVGAEVNLYADSYHDFDSPVGEVRLRLDVPNGLHPGQGVHVGPNPAAREQAYARLRELLAQAFR